MTDLMLAFQTTGPARAWLALGVLSIVAGMLFVFWPGLSLAAFLIWLSIGAIVVGLTETVTALRLRAAARAES